MENKQILSLAFTDGENKYSLDTTNAVTITRAGAPTSATIGKIGQFYMDTNTGDLYKCVAVTSTGYNWKLESQLVQYFITLDEENNIISSRPSFDELWYLINVKKQYPCIILCLGATYMTLLLEQANADAITFRTEGSFVFIYADNTISIEGRHVLYAEDMIQNTDNFESIDYPPSALAVKGYVTKRLAQDKILIEFQYDTENQQWIKSTELSYEEFDAVYHDGKKLCVAHLVNHDHKAYTTDIIYIPDYFIITSSLGKLKWDKNDQITELQNSDLPQYTDADNGKILTLVEGVPTWQANTVSEEISNTLDTILVNQQEVIYL